MVSLLYKLCCDTIISHCINFDILPKLVQQSIIESGFLRKKITTNNIITYYKKSRSLCDMILYLYCWYYTDIHCMGSDWYNDDSSYTDPFDTQEKCTELSNAFYSYLDSCIDWNIISKCMRLDDRFINENCYQLRWDLVCQYQVLSEKIMREFSWLVHWLNVIKYQYVPISFVKQNADKKYWNNFMDRNILSIHDINLLIRILGFSYLYDIFKGQMLPDVFIEECLDYADWISRDQTLSERFIENHRNKILNWYNILLTSKTLPEFIDT